MPLPTRITNLCNNNVNATNTVYVQLIKTPLGELYAAADDVFLYIVAFEDAKFIEKTFHTVASNLSCKFVEGSNKILSQLEQELKQYFDGTLKKFTVPIKTFGTDFQKEVWDKLLELPYGTTQTYGDLAKALGRSPSHSRAVGAACGANSHLLVIPCHRLVASGSKGGFSSGLDRKEKLLEHEKQYASSNFLKPSDQ